MSQKRIAIMGAGSLGTILGAYLNKAGIKVDLIDAYKAHVDALNQNGAKVVGQVEMVVPVKALTPDQMEGEYDIFLYIAKQTSNQTALPKMKQHLSKNGFIITLQNGIPEPAIQAVVGEDRVVGCPVGWGATFKGPGVSELTSKVEAMTFDIGEPKGGDSPRLHEIKAILENMCPTHILDNLPGIRWTKVLVNSTLSGLSAVTGGTFGDVLDSEKALDIVTYVGNEVVKVGRAQGVRFEKMAGYPIADMISWTTEEERQKLKATYKAFFTPHRALKASMLQDLEKGLMTEIMAINGVTYEGGRKLGIPTPANDFVVDMVSSHQEKKSKPNFECLDLFYSKYLKK